jgi:hypothetical protein
MEICSYFDSILHLAFYRQKYRSLPNTNKVNLPLRLPISLQNIDVTHLLVESTSQSTNTSNLIIFLKNSILYALLHVISVLIVREVLNYNILRAIVLLYLRLYAVQISYNRFDFLTISMHRLIEIISPSITQYNSLTNTHKK